MTKLLDRTWDSLQILYLQTKRDYEEQYAIERLRARVVQQLVMARRPMDGSLPRRVWKAAHTRFRWAWVYNQIDHLFARPAVPLPARCGLFVLGNAAVFGMAVGRLSAHVPWAADRAVIPAWAEAVRSPDGWTLQLPALHLSVPDVGVPAGLVLDGNVKHAIWAAATRDSGGAGSIGASATTSTTIVPARLRLDYVRGRGFVGPVVRNVLEHLTGYVRNQMLVIDQGFESTMTMQADSVILSMARWAEINRSTVIDRAVLVAETLVPTEHRDRPLYVQVWRYFMVLFVAPTLERLMAVRDELDRTEGDPLQDVPYGRSSPYRSLLVDQLREDSRTARAAVLAPPSEELVRNADRPDLYRAWLTLDDRSTLTLWHQSGAPCSVPIELDEPERLDVALPAPVVRVELHDVDLSRGDVPENPRVGIVVKCATTNHRKRRTE